MNLFPGSKNRGGSKIAKAMMWLKNVRMFFGV